jgi:hypothetical protein
VSGNARAQPRAGINAPHACTSGGYCDATPPDLSEC